MASIKVSELPAVTSITPSDVLIINDENLTTSSITISLFTSSFTGQNLSFTGTASFGQPVTFESASLPTFNSGTVFNQGVTFNGSITLGTAALIPLGALSNVNLASAIPTGQVLAYDAVNAEWVNSPTGSMNNLVDDTTPQLGGNLDVNGYEIVSAATVAGPNAQNIILNPDGAGYTVFTGNSTRGAGGFKLNCEVNTHGITVVGPDHSASASYTFKFPVNMGTAGQALLTDGTSQTSWATVLRANVDNNIQHYSDNTAALNAGLPVGAIYRTNADLKVVVAA